MPKHFYDEREAAKISDFQKSIAVTRKPYFMIYRYSDIASKWRKYHKKANINSQLLFDIQVDDLVKKTEKTDQEEEFVSYYKKYSPVSLGQCTMNKICWKVEEVLAGIKNDWKSKTDLFNYTIYKSTDCGPYNARSFARIMNILDDYEREVKTIHMYADANHMDDDAVSSYKSILSEVVQQECYCNCSNLDELCNIVLDLTYGRGRSYQVAWDVCGDVIIRNLLRRNNQRIRCYMKDPGGDIEYMGERFSAKILFISDEEGGGATDLSE